MAVNRQAAQRLRSWRASDTGGAELDLEGAVAEISVRPDGSTRLRAAAGHSLPPDPGPGIGRDFQPPGASRPHPVDDGGLRINHEGPEGVADVSVEADPFALRIRDRGGAILELQAAFGPRIIERSGFEGVVEALKKIMLLELTVSEVPMRLDSSLRVGRSKMKLFKTIRGYFSLLPRARRWDRAARAYRNG